MAMIHAKNASLTYPDGTQALKPFDLSVNCGEVVYITGPSGSGKTSLLKLLMGIEFATTGQLDVLNQSMTPHNEAAIRRMRQRIGPIFQDFRLLEGRSVLDNVLLGMRFLQIPAGEMKTLALESIQKVGLGHKTHHTIDRLSWGECQRVTIARAVARKPALVIADEPTGNLDRANALNILTLLTSFKSHETSVLITTHATHLVDMDQQGLYLSMDAGVLTTERRGGDA